MGGGGSKTSYLQFNFCEPKIVLNTFLRLCVIMHLSAYGYARVSAYASRGQKRVSCPLQLESQAAVSCPVWVLGTNRESLRRSRSLDHEPSR